MAYVNEAGPHYYNRPESARNSYYISDSERGHATVNTARPAPEFTSPSEPRSKSTLIATVAMAVIVLLLAAGLFIYWLVEPGINTSSVEGAGGLQGTSTTLAPLTPSYPVKGKPIPDSYDYTDGAQRPVTFCMRDQIPQKFWEGNQTVHKMGAEDALDPKSCHRACSVVNTTGKRDSYREMVSFCTWWVWEAAREDVMGAYDNCYIRTQSLPSREMINADETTSGMLDCSFI